jgi:hypothetical protein
VYHVPEEYQMIRLIQTKVACPFDGHDIFIVQRESDAVANGSVGEAEVLEPLCRRCDPHRYIELLRVARFISVSHGDAPPDNLKK